MIFLQLSGAAGVHVGVCRSCEVERYSQGMCVCVECECAAGVVMLNGASKCVCGVCHREVEVPQSVCVCGVCHFKVERCPNMRVGVWSMSPWS